ncbi:class II aldolase/adducin family protein [Undibacterium sp. Di26W]|uniref:class II aldolase/adducin family protein n=1 Tax=Undibacterium sp. Di26W TaxID=3413035 RepID=UPI003BEF709A
MIPNSMPFRESVVKFCADAGKNSLLVQGAGGNVSWKDGDTLWVKASGTRLADALDRDVFVGVDLLLLQKAIGDGNFSAKPVLKQETQLKPSIETLLHAVMPHSVVVHLHAIEPLAYLVRENAEDEIQERLKTKLAWSIIEYQKPGDALAKAVADVIARDQNINIILLRNHGIVIGGDSIEDVIDELAELLNLLAAPKLYGVLEFATPTMINIPGIAQYVPVNIPGIHSLACNTVLFNALEQKWALYPDHIVFLGKNPHSFDDLSSFLAFIESGLVPELIFIKGLGVFSIPSFSFAQRAQLGCYYDVMMRQPMISRLKALNNFQIDELFNWDAEKYRQKTSM